MSMSEIDKMIEEGKRDTLIKRCRFRKWNRQQRKKNKRGPFYHIFLVSSSVPYQLERVDGNVEGNLVTFPHGTHVFQNICGPVYLLPNGDSCARGHRYELNTSGWYGSYYWEERTKKLNDARDARRAGDINPLLLDDL